MILNLYLLLRFCTWEYCVDTRLTLQHLVWTPGSRHSFLCQTPAPSF